MSKAKTPRTHDTAVENDASAAVKVGLVIFAIILALCGGSSRYDLPQVLVILPAAMVCGAFALFFIKRDDMRGFGWMLCLLLLLTLLMAAQLVPLPHDFWASLSGRGTAAAVDNAIGIAPSRPMSLDPARTTHALFSLSVPVAALLIFVALRNQAVSWIFGTVIAIAGLNAIVGLLQEIGGNVDFLYFYQITIAQASVGIFANPNHASVFNALIMVVVAVAIKMLPPMRGNRLQRVGLMATFVLLLLANFVNTSRAGLATTLVALVFTAILFAYPLVGRKLRNRKRTAQFSTMPIVRVVMVFAAIAIVGALYLLFERSPAVDQLVAEDPLQDIRFLITPTIVDMIETYFPIGAGFGAFESTYYIAEERGLLMRAYLNNAHNDWLQWLVEGGLPAALLLLAFIFFIGRTMIRLWRRPHIQGGRSDTKAADTRDVALGALAAFFIISVASYGDYPLRTPMFQAVCIWLTALLVAISLPRFSMGLIGYRVR